MKKIEVCAAIIIKDNKIFTTQRGYGSFKGMWEFPGGKLEPNETKEGCIVREIKEELDAEINIIQYLNTIEYQYDTFYLIMHNFICELKNDHINLNEHDAAKFISINELDKVEFLPADLLIFDDLIKYLNKK